MINLLILLSKVRILSLTVLCGHLGRNLLWKKWTISILLFILYFNISIGTLWFIFVVSNTYDLSFLPFLFSHVMGCYFYYLSLQHIHYLKALQQQNLLPSKSSSTKISTYLSALFYSFSTMVSSCTLLLLIGCIYQFFCSLSVPINIFFRRFCRTLALNVWNISRL